MRGGSSSGRSPRRERSPAGSGCGPGGRRTSGRGPGGYVERGLAMEKVQADIIHHLEGAPDPGAEAGRIRALPVRVVVGLREGPDKPATVAGVAAGNDGGALLRRHRLAEDGHHLRGVPQEAGGGGRRGGGRVVA